jgi:TolA-binding protein
MAVFQVIFGLLAGSGPRETLNRSNTSGQMSRSAKGENMDAKNYCRSVEVELYGWKAKMYDMVRKVEKLRSSDKERVAAQVEQLHRHIEDMEHIIEQLQTECPLEFGSEKQQIEETTSGLKNKYEEAMSAVLQF